jgi:hypothetical protein
VGAGLELTVGLGDGVAGPVDDGAVDDGVGLPLGVTLAELGLGLGLWLWRAGAAF